MTAEADQGTAIVAIYVEVKSFCYCTLT